MYFTAEQIRTGYILKPFHSNRDYFFAWSLDREEIFGVVHWLPSGDWETVRTGQTFDNPRDAVQAVKEGKQLCSLKQP